MKFSSLTALLVSVSAIGIVPFIGCSSHDVSVLAGTDPKLAASASSDGVEGSLRLSLEAGARDVSSVTAVLSGGPGFETQTHQIDVSDPNSVISLFFGGLPPGQSYTIELTAGDCRGLSTFNIEPGQVTSVNVVLVCSAGSADAGLGGVEITGTFADAGAAGPCNPIANLSSAAPSVDDGSAPALVRLVLRDGASATAISWSSSGVAGTIGDLSGDADTDVSFTCSAAGKAEVLATVTAATEAGTCTEQGRISIPCSNPTAPAPRCGDGLIQDGEQCDGDALPADAGVPGTTCSPSCTLVPPVAPRCGDGVINQDSEQCDGDAVRADAGAPDAVCSSSCTLEVPQPPLCGDGKINQEGEQCDGLALPAGAPPGSSCRADCTLAPPVVLGECGRCAADNCAAERATVDASAAASPLLDCVLGPDWRNGDRAPADACGNNDLLTCYCGSLSSSICSVTPPAALDGACTQQVLAATNCTTSDCVGSGFLSPGNDNGKAMLFVQCEQTLCYDVCFAF